MFSERFQEEIRILDETGAEVGRVNRVQFVMSNFSLFKVKPPEIVGDTVTTAEIARYVEEGAAKLETFVRPLVEWAAAGIEQVSRVFKPLYDYLEDNPQLTAGYYRGPHITRQRIGHQPKGKR